VARPSDLAARVDRLESLDEIRQLVAKYCLALDMRDADAWVGLYPTDVRAGRDAVGRAALRGWFDATMRERFTGTAHVTGNHVVEFDDADHAHGVVYSRNEHEMDGRWIVMTMMYWDQYERRRDEEPAGRWYFRRRLPLYWYAVHATEPPVGPLKMRWPDQEPWESSWHDFWPSWRRFWSEAAPDADVAAPAALDEFLDRMRAGSDAPHSVRVV
jgi:hypothetical protein